MKKIIALLSILTIFPLTAIAAPISARVLPDIPTQKTEALSNYYNYGQSDQYEFDLVSGRILKISSYGSSSRFGRLLSKNYLDPVTLKPQSLSTRTPGLAFHSIGRFGSIVWLEATESGPVFYRGTSSGKKERLTLPDIDSLDSDGNAHYALTVRDNSKPGQSPKLWISIWGGELYSGQVDVNRKNISPALYVDGKFLTLSSLDNGRLNFVTYGSNYLAGFAPSSNPLPGHTNESTVLVATNSSGQTLNIDLTNYPLVYPGNQTYPKKPIYLHMNTSSYTFLSDSVLENLNFRENQFFERLTKVPYTEGSEIPVNKGVRLLKSNQEFLLENDSIIGRPILSSDGNLVGLHPTPYNPVIWSEKYGYRSLNDYRPSGDWRFIRIDEIRNSQQVLGQGIKGNKFVSFLLTLPERDPKPRRAPRLDFSKLNPIDVSIKPTGDCANYYENAGTRFGSTKNDGEVSTYVKSNEECSFVVTLQDVAGIVVPNKTVEIYAKTRTGFSIFDPLITNRRILRGKTNRRGQFTFSYRPGDITTAEGPFVTLSAIVPTVSRRNNDIPAEGLRKQNNIYTEVR